MSAIPDPAYALTPSGNLRRRQFVNRAFEGATIGAAGLAVAVLFILVYYTAKQGIGQLSLGFFTKPLPGPSGVGGGVGPVLLGSLELVLMSTAIALPIGVLTALYLSEFANPRVARPLSIALELMAGLPTIVIGIFVAGLLVDHFQQSGLAGSVALAIVQVPLIARASLESITRVPKPLREAADALGIARWRTVVGVILPTAANGIVTATILALARAAGETAPLLFTTSAFTGAYQLNPLQAVPNAPFQIWIFANANAPAAAAKAWGLAFVLMATILLINIGARVWLRRSERKRGA